MRRSRWRAFFEVTSEDEATVGQRVIGVGVAPHIGARDNIEEPGGCWTQEAARGELRYLSEVRVRFGASAAYLSMKLPR